MPYRNLDEFLIRLEQNNELIRIQQSVNSRFDVMTLTQEMMRQPTIRNKALWFERVIGYDLPIVTNLFGTERRMAWALGLEALTDLKDHSQQLIKMGQPATMSSLLGRAGEMMGLIRSTGIGRFPKPVSNDRIISPTETPDLTQLPFLHQWPDEPYPSINHVPVIIRTDKEDNQQLIFTSLVMYDGQHLGVAIDKDTLPPDTSACQPIPAAVILGGDPAMMWADSLKLPTGINPLWVAGWLRRRPIPMMQGKTQNIVLPTDAEVTIEGWIDPCSRSNVGPLAGFDGFYVAPQPMFTMHITNIHYRDNSVFPIIINSPYSMELHWMRMAAENLFSPLISMLINEVHTISLPAEGVGVNLLIASINKQFAGQAHKVLYGLLGMEQLALNKTIVILDSDIDVHNIAAIGEAIICNVHSEQDIVRLPGLLHPHDATSKQSGFGTKLGIDATRKATQANGVSDMHWWDRLKIIPVNSKQEDIHALITTHRQSSPYHHLILVEPEFALYNPSDLLRVVLASVDWQHDLWLYPTEPLSIVIDATRRHKGLPASLKTLSNQNI